MTRKWPALLLLPAALLLLWGCGGPKTKSVTTQYYTLEYEPPAAAGREPLPVVLRVGQFRAAPPYDTDRIVFRQGPFSRNTYFYHRWQATPGVLVPFFLGRDLQRSGLFAAVISEPGHIAPGYWLEGTVEEFLERDEGDRWEARLSVNVILSAANPPTPGKGILFQKTFAAAKPCTQKNPAALAEAMSLALAEVSREITEAVYQALEPEGAARK